MRFERAVASEQLLERLPLGGVVKPSGEPSPGVARPAVGVDRMAESRHVHCEDPPGRVCERRALAVLDDWQRHSEEGCPAELVAAISSCTRSAFNRASSPGRLSSSAANVAASVFSRSATATSSLRPISSRMSRRSSVLIAPPPRHQQRRAELRPRGDYASSALVTSPRRMIAGVSGTTTVAGISIPSSTRSRHARG